MADSSAPFEPDSGFVVILSEGTHLSGSGATSATCETTEKGTHLAGTVGLDDDVVVVEPGSWGSQGTCFEQEKEKAGIPLTGGTMHPAIPLTHVQSQLSQPILLPTAPHVHQPLAHINANNTTLMAQGKEPSQESGNPVTVERGREKQQEVLIQANRPGAVPAVLDKSIVSLSGEKRKVCITPSARSPVGLGGLVLPSAKRHRIAPMSGWANDAPSLPRPTLSKLSEPNSIDRHVGDGLTTARRQGPVIDIYQRKMKEWLTASGKVEEKSTITPVVTAPPRLKTTVVKARPALPIMTTVKVPNPARGRSGKPAWVQKAENAPAATAQLISAAARCFPSHSEPMWCSGTTEYGSTIYDSSNATQTHAVSGWARWQAAATKAREEGMTSNNAADVLTLGRHLIQAEQRLRRVNTQTKGRNQPRGVDDRVQRSLLSKDGFNMSEFAARIACAAAGMSMRDVVKQTLQDRIVQHFSEKQREVGKRGVQSTARELLNRLQPPSQRTVSKPLTKIYDGKKQIRGESNVADTMPHRKSARMSQNQETSEQAAAGRAHQTSVRQRLPWPVDCLRAPPATGRRSISMAQIARSTLYDGSWNDSTAWSKLYKGISQKTTGFRE